VDPPVARSRPFADGDHLRTADQILSDLVADDPGDDGCLQLRDQPGEDVAIAQRLDLEETGLVDRREGVRQSGLSHGRQHAVRHHVAKRPVARLACAQRLDV
jgi:hypothetical protein